jgi:hypothetical protein
MCPVPLRFLTLYLFDASPPPPQESVKTTPKQIWLVADLLATLKCNLQISNCSLHISVRGEILLRYQSYEPQGRRPACDVKFKSNFSNFHKEMSYRKQVLSSTARTSIYMVFRSCVCLTKCLLQLSLSVPLYTASSLAVPLATLLVYKQTARSRQCSSTGTVQKAYHWFYFLCNIQSVHSESFAVRFWYCMYTTEKSNLL